MKATNTKITKLNLRQWSLYLFIDRHKDGVSKDDICDEFKYHYPRYAEIQRGISEHCSSAYALIRDDIKTLNQSNEITKIIICVKNKSNKNYVYRIATREEYKQWAEQQEKSILKKLSRLRIKDRKYNRDGQMKIIYDNNSNEKDYYETFNK